MRPSLLLAALLCSAAAPVAPVPTADEEAQLAKGDIVVRHLDSAQGGGVLALVDIAATPSKVLGAAMDLQARVEENGAITGLDVYLDESAPERVGAEWTLSVIGTTVKFSILYACERDQGYCTFALDPTRSNDVVSSDGYYLVTARGGGTRLVYASRSDSGRSMPGFVKRWIAGNSLTTQVEGIRTRAQAP